jgi:hypothetical protein
MRLIVLPLLPDRGFGPHAALNPTVIWRIVMIVMAMQAAGYIALRAIGPRYGPILVGRADQSTTSRPFPPGGVSLGAPATCAQPERRTTIASALSVRIEVVAQVALEPVACEPSDHFQRAGLFE